MITKENFNFVLDKAYNELSEQKVSNPMKALDLKKAFDLGLKDNPLDSNEDINQIISNVFKYSVNTQSAKFLNQLYGGTSDITWMSELIVSILNTSMATYEIAPLFTLMEKELISEIKKVVGFKKADGIMVPGGSYANLYAIHCARYRKNPAVKQTGLFGQNKFCVFVSEAAHYSSEKAMNLLGFGTDQLVKVKTDQEHKISISDLEDKIKQAIAKKMTPLCIVSTSGTTVWGSFDRIQEVQKIADTYQLWHHVDAAWGGLALWSEEDKEELFKGVSDVDSITLDFHKLMSSSLTKAFFICSDPESFYKSSSGGGSEYIFHNETDEQNYDTGVYALQCGRKVDSFPLWFQWKVGGASQFRDKYDELKKLKEFCVSHINSESEHFELLHDPEFMNICFKVKPNDRGSSQDGYSDDNGAAFNKSLREKLMSRGHYMVNFSKDGEHGAFFRLVLNHWKTKKEDLIGLFEELKSIKS